VVQGGGGGGEEGEGGMHGATHVVGGGYVRLPVMAEHADPEPAQVVPEGLSIAWDGPAQAPRIPRVVAGEGFQDEGTVLDGAGKRAAVIERVGIGDHTGAAHQPEGGHESHRPAV